MGLIVECPLPAALTPIGDAACPVKLDQIVRLAFQRTQAVAPFPTLVDIQTQADWDAFIAAVDSTKVVLTPIFANLVIPNSEALTTGGNDNTTFNGMPQYNGEGFVLVTGTFYNMAPEPKANMEKLSQESLANGIGGTNLSVYMWNRVGQGMAKKVGLTYSGIPIYNFRISSRGSAGLNASDTHQFSFTLPGDWDTLAAMFKPTFDPLTELVEA